MLAIYGYKMSSNASKEWSGTFKELQQKQTKVKKLIRHLSKNVLVTADIGFANEANMEYLHHNKINAYVPDNQFRSRDPKFAEQKAKYGKRQPINKIETRYKEVIPASEFNFDAQTKTCICPIGETMWLKREGMDRNGNHHKLYFEGRLSKCRVYPLKEQCMQNPDSANHRTCHVRQVSFIIDKEKKSTLNGLRRGWIAILAKWFIGIACPRLSRCLPILVQIKG